MIEEVRLGLKDLNVPHGSLIFGVQGSRHMEPPCQKLNKKYVDWL